MFDPGYLIFWPGALATAGFVALPIAMGLQRWRRRIARRRNVEWRCGQCNGELWPDDVSGQLFVAHGIHVCAACAELYRKRYRAALVSVPAVALLAGLGSVMGLMLDPRPLSWYIGSPLVPLLLPSVGLVAAFWWRIRVAKNANVPPGGRSTILVSDADRDRLPLNPER